MTVDDEHAGGREVEDGRGVGRPNLEIGAGEHLQAARVDLHIEGAVHAEPLVPAVGGLLEGQLPGKRDRESGRRECKSLRLSFNVELTRPGVDLDEVVGVAVRRIGHFPLMARIDDAHAGAGRKLNVVAGERAEDRGRQCAGVELAGEITVGDRKDRVAGKTLEGDCLGLGDAGGVDLQKGGAAHGEAILLELVEIALDLEDTP